MNFIEGILTMLSAINRNNLKALCTGSSFLGSGGGGDVNVLYEIVNDALLKYGPVSIMQPNDLGDEERVVSIELIGAPLPLEMRDCDVPFLIAPILDFIQHDLGGAIHALMPVEIGGSNALVPLCIAGSLNVPIVDCDLLGRALPEITMISTHIFDRMPDKAYISNPTTGEVSVITCTSYAELETKGRAIASSYKNCAAVLVPVVLTGKEVKQMAIHQTISQSIQIGMQDTLEGLCQIIQGTIQCTGIVTQWSGELKAGFLSCEIMIKTQNNQRFFVRVKMSFYP